MTAARGERIGYSGPKIERIYAWVAADGKGEALVSVKLANKAGWMNLIAGSREQAENFRSLAQGVANGIDNTVFLKVFTIGIVIEAIEPR